MNEINITLPAIDESVIANIETETKLSADTETAAFGALRKSYAPLAKQAGYIKISWWDNGYSSGERFHKINGRSTRGFRVHDSFEKDQNQRDDTSGYRSGYRLYLTAAGEWLELKSYGHWSKWENSTDWWTCDGVVFEDHRDDTNQVEDGYYHTRILTDGELVPEGYSLTNIVNELKVSLTKTAQTLPERLAGIKRRTQLASTLLTALTSNEKV